MAKSCAKRAQRMRHAQQGGVVPVSKFRQLTKTTVDLMSSKRTGWISIGKSFPKFGRLDILTKQHDLVGKQQQSKDNCSCQSSQSLLCSKSPIESWGQLFEVRIDTCQSLPLEIIESRNLQIVSELISNLSNWLNCTKNVWRDQRQRFKDFYFY